MVDEICQNSDELRRCLIQNLMGHPSDRQYVLERFEEEHGWMADFTEEYPISKLVHQSRALCSFMTNIKPMTTWHTDLNFEGMEPNDDIELILSFVEPGQTMSLRLVSKAFCRTYDNTLWFWMAPKHLRITSNGIVDGDITTGVANHWARRALLYQYHRSAYRLEKHWLASAIVAHSHIGTQHTGLEWTTLELHYLLHLPSELLHPDTELTFKPDCDSLLLGLAMAHLNGQGVSQHMGLFGCKKVTLPLPFFTQCLEVCKDSLERLSNQQLGPIGCRGLDPGMPSLKLLEIIAPHVTKLEVNCSLDQLYLLVLGQYTFPCLETLIATGQDLRVSDRLAYHYDLPATFPKLISIDEVLHTMSSSSPSPYDPLLWQLAQTPTLNLTGKSGQGLVYDRFLRLEALRQTITSEERETMYEEFLVWARPQVETVRDLIHMPDDDIDVPLDQLQEFLVCSQECCF